MEFPILLPSLVVLVILLSVYQPALLSSPCMHCLLPAAVNQTYEARLSLLFDQLGISVYLIFAAWLHAQTSAKSVHYAVIMHV